MQNALRTVLFILVFGAGVLSCGDSSSSLDSHARLADLSSDQQKKLCDEIANAQGGYGRSTTCQDGSVQTTDANQSECVNALLVVKQLCPSLTVGDNLGCAQGVGRDLCLFATAPACKAARDCLATISGP